MKVSTVSLSESPTLLSRKGWLRFGFAFLIFGLSALMIVPRVDADAWWLHGLWCVIGMALSLPTLIRVYRVGFMVVLQDHRVMLTAAFTLYFLFGASLLAFGSEDEIAYSLHFYSIGARDAVRADAINAVGFGTALMASALSSGRWIGKQADRVAMVAGRVPTFVVMVSLMLVGALASFEVLMVDFALRDDNVSGILRTASKFVLVAIFLGGSYRGRHELWLRMMAVSLTVIEAMSGVLLFNKTAMLLPIGALIAGLSVRYEVRKVLPTGILILIALFASVGGAVSYGRNTLERDLPYSLEVRWHTFQKGFVEAREGGDDRAQYYTWSRLCYLPVQSAAYDFYKMGNGGDELQLIPWLFVPRFLAPNKPSNTQVGVDFNQKITGSDKSSSGMGLFSSGYYNAGWLGLLIISSICGWIIAQTSAIANAIFNRKAYLLLPFALLGVYMSFRIDGHFVGDSFGMFIILLYPILFLSFGITLTKRRT